jgi:hypothetical protein
MPTSDESWSTKLRVVGELERPDHWFLTDRDVCCFFGEYTSGVDFRHSETNQFIHNLKKGPETRGTPQWNYKTRAIRRAGVAIAKNIKEEALSKVIFVPIPPSKPPIDPEYDDRMARVARAISPDADVREVLCTKTKRAAMHSNPNRRDPAALRASLQIRREFLGQPSAEVVLLDDLLTTGCSFMVCEAMLSEVWPEANISGIFIARRVLEKDGTRPEGEGGLRF